MGRVTIALAGLRADQSYADAARQVIDVRSRELFARAEGLFDLAEPERVHKMRVATRRLRSALEVFAPCFPAEEQRAVLVEVKKLAAVLGERRDCDVQTKILADLRPRVGRRERDAIDNLLGAVRRDQRKANRRLAKALARAERKGLATQLQQLSR
jgi:CHAD domain-containing protein